MRAASSELYRWLQLSIEEEPSVGRSQMSPQNSATERHSEFSQYALATSEPGSDLSVAPRRMSLGPSGARMLRSRLKEGTTLPPETRKGLQIEANQTANGFHGAQPTGQLESYFQTAKDLFLREQQAAPFVSRASQSNRVGTQDVDMESVGPPTHAEDAGEYGPDDGEIPTSNRTAIAMTAGGDTTSPNVRPGRVHEERPGIG
ncbi:hypothetical protein PI125_g11326 [Phytophthora idaei]|nr:hypothetical protein PI125_g11326 [Phytophthora idaei]